ncbi:hypothetical protein SteCoe_36023 [Stentor coeruleus]|uniref:Uncharacterized protein n=1 Tax=Stentor coeruleus TaxID=5963 RepID=A0A1R2AR22_9CILI|nr:hypothetical protein SteCoe_36023 [Stentor coeruleus]
MASFKDKTQENREFALRLYKEQKIRKNRKEQREEEIRRKMIEEIEEKERENKMMRMKKEQNKLEQLNIMKERSLERKRALSYLKEIGNKEFRKAMSSTPLYKKIEDEYYNNVLVPEFEKRKVVLKKKKDYLKPITLEELKEHARNVENILSSLSKQKKQSQHLETQTQSKSKIIKRLLAEDKEKELVEQEKQMKKKHLIEKTKQYSELVKEVFPPTHDMFKQKEMELIRYRLDHPVTVKYKASNSDDESNFVNKSVSFSPKKYKKNTMIPEKPPKRLPVIKDYIMEMREAKKHSLSSSNIKIKWPNETIEDQTLSNNNEKLQRKAEQLDRQIRKSEQKIDYSIPLNTKTLKATESVGNLIVDSIKAKLAILENNTYENPS